MYVAHSQKRKEKKRKEKKRKEKDLTFISQNRIYVDPKQVRLPTNDHGILEQIRPSIYPSLSY